MSLKKPYYRIIRSGTDCDYMLDKMYANNRFELCRAYDIIVNDFKKVFEYIEPSDINLEVYSHRLYELLLRAATECETNFTSILKDNGYNEDEKEERNLNIIDYHLINISSKLSDYEVKLNFWKPTKILKPFSDWEESYKLNWYSDYNKVKHNRYNKFNNASFDNVLKAVAGLFVVLFSQFDIYTFNGYQDNNESSEDDDGFICTDRSIFSIKKPEFLAGERYDFDWRNIKKENNPLNKFNFNSLKRKERSEKKLEKAKNEVKALIEK